MVRGAMPRCKVCILLDDSLLDLEHFANPIACGYNLRTLAGVPNIFMLLFESGPPC